jgi:hypothetical protein
MGSPRFWAGIHTTPAAPGRTGGKEAGIVAAEKESSHGFCEVWKKSFNRGKEDEPRQRQKRR